MYDPKKKMKLNQLNQYTKGELKIVRGKRGNGNDEMKLKEEMITMMVKLLRSITILNVGEGIKQSTKWFERESIQLIYYKDKLEIDQIVTIRLKLNLIVLKDDDDDDKITLHLTKY